MGARPFVVGVAELVRRLGTRMPVRRSAPVGDLAISTASVTPGEDVTIEVELESISNGIVAAGTLHVPWIGACRRCLEPVHGEVTAEVREIFERHPIEGETYPLDGDTVDLEPMVHDAVLLALPLAPLCAAACRGPEPGEFPTTVEGGDVAAGEADPGAGGDPRWAALDELKFD